MFTSSTRTLRTLLASALVGVLHAAAILAVALHLGYPVGPGEYGAVGLAWRYGGLVVVAAIPAALALRYGLLAPVAAVALTASYVLWMEVTPPGPTFESRGPFLVVEDGLYAIRYVVNASVWTVGFLLVGLVEYVARERLGWLPPVRRRATWLPVPASNRRAAATAAVVGLLHAAVMVWFAHRLGMSASAGPAWALYLFGGIGMWLLAALPTYALLRYGLLVPASLLTAFVLLDVRAEFTAGPSDPHALYFGAWFLYLAILVVAGAVEYGLRRLRGRRRRDPASRS